MRRVAARWWMAKFVVWLWTSSRVSGFAPAVACPGARRLGSHLRWASTRADVACVELGLAETRSKAVRLIEAGLVLRERRSGGPGEGHADLVRKPAEKVDSEVDRLVLAAPPPRFVSRAGDKLEALLQAPFLAGLADSIHGCRALDVGASTGGFTDCLLQRGATQVCCVDVGRGQLHPSLLKNPKVLSFEGINARNLTAAQIAPCLPPFDVLVVDVSFISLELVLLPAWHLLAPGTGLALLLVKPQFEAGKAAVKKGRGVVVDPMDRQKALDKIRAFARNQLPASIEVGWLESPIVGGDGNREWLLALRKSSPS
mmetsp:Transcript_3129/g.9050  ORF Transcript_3129/g.9050 Transcript_3129/m.9050 type:complete len:314 (-) Transcript_3129:57-998(-)